MAKIDVAVILIAFSRVELARKTFNAIKEAQPSRFYFYSNKAREEFPEECEKNEEVRALAQEVDWVCEFKVWFRDKPVGVLDSLRGAINWFFENEESGIILEDDSMPCTAFFDFSAKMLYKYRSNQKVWMIGGSNYAENFNPNNESYHFSKNFFINGWASWRDRWQKISWEDFDALELVRTGVIDSYYTDPQICKYHKSKIKEEAVSKKLTKCWDFLFWYTGVLNDALCITPAHNLVQNLGGKGVHQGPYNWFRAQLHLVPFNRINYNGDTYIISKPPKKVEENKGFDKAIYQNWLSKQVLWYFKIARKFYHKLKK